MLKHLDNQNFCKALESYKGSKIPRDDWKDICNLATRGANALLGDYSQLTASDKRDYIGPCGSIKFYFDDKLKTEYIFQREAGRQLFNHLWDAGTQEDMTFSATTDAINNLTTSAAAASQTINNTANIWSNISDANSICIEQPVYKSEFESVKTKLNKATEELKIATGVYQSRLNDTECEIRDLWNRTNTNHTILNDKINALDERERSCTNTIDWLVNSKFAVLEEAIESIKNRIEQLSQINCEEAKGNKEDIMNTNSMFNFDFGRVTDAVRVSTYGLAIKGVDGRYVSWDNKNKSVMDVEVLSMPGSEFVYKIPVAIKDVKVGDVVVHNRVPMYVTAVNAQTLTVVDIREATEKTIYPVKSPFGFNFVTKVVSLFDSVNGTASADAPFGNMLPFMLMGNNDMDPMMLMMMNQNGNTNLMSNPMMMYFLMKDGKGSDMLPFVMMGMMNQPATTPQTQNK